MAKTDKKCSVCKSSNKYNSKYDSYYCEICNKWTEDRCGDPNCTFCEPRPEKPL